MIKALYSHLMKAPPDTSETIVRIKIAVEEVGDNLGNQENKWRGGVVGRDGCVYGIPCWATRVLKFDPSSNTNSLIGDVGEGLYKWSGGVLCPRGFIYGIPCNSHHILKIDPVEGTTSLVGGDLGAGRMKWISGVLANDGCIYCMPYDARHILRFDPVTEQTTLVGDDLGDGYKYSATVLSDDGTLAGIPFNASKVVKFDPRGSTTTTHIGQDLGNGGAKWCGGVEGVDGNIYGVPNFYNHILQVEPTRGCTSIVGRRQHGCKGKWYGGSAGEDGYLYFTPSCSKRVLKFNPSNRSAVLLEPELSGDYYKWSGSVLGGDGYVYFIPSSSPQILRVNTRTTIGNVHQVVRMKLWSNVGRLLEDGSVERDVKSRALCGKNKDGHNVLCAALKRGAPSELIVDIVKANYLLLAEVDRPTGLYPFMFAGVGTDAKLSAVYDILRCHPALIHEFL